MDDSWAWVALALVPGIGWNARRYHDLLGVGSPSEVFRASRRTLAAAVGEELATAIKAFDVAGAIARQRAAAELRRSATGTPDREFAVAATFEGAAW